MTRVRADIAAVEEILTAFSRTTEDVYTLDELRERLRSGRQLRMKYGIDLTAPELHIGHGVNLWMYRALQELGHRMILLLGDFTTTIGDPTGRSTTRPVLEQEVIEANAQALLDQALTILRDDPDVIEIRRNSEWSKSMSARDLLGMMSTVTLDRLMSRDMFRRRAEQGLEIHAHELVYPLLQGYDSVVLESDLTIIGTDQLFNETMGRWLQQRNGQSPQVIITTTITPGIDGKEKQSKSLGNYIVILHSPREKFGRVMRIPDSLVRDYYLVYADVAESEIERLLMGDPMEAKLMLATAIVGRYHGNEVAEAERAWFIETFSERRVPEDIPVVTVYSSATLIEVLRAAFPPQTSNSQLRRLVAQGAVELDDEKMLEFDVPVTPAPDGSILKVGKRRWFRVVAPG